MSWAGSDGGWGDEGQADQGGGFGDSDSGFEGGDFGSGGFGETSYGGLSGNLSDTGIGGFGGFGDVGLSDSGTGGFGGFGDVGFGPGGTSYAGGGFLNANIAGISALSPNVANAIRAMSTVEQETIFSTVISPTLDQYTGWQGDLGKTIAKTVFGALANAALPGLGSLAKLTGATGYLADRMMDMSFSQSVADQLGLGTSSGNVTEQAVSAGKSTGEILSAIDTTIRKQGGDMASWDDIWGGITGSTAAGAATGAATTQAAYQQRALDYLKSREAVPLEISGGALQQLGGLYGLPGGVGDQQAFIDQARQSPLYGAIVGGREQGEEAIMRRAGMTGGLRSGNVQEALYDYNTQLENRALMGAYGEQLGGLQYLAGMQPQGAAGIAGMTAGIGGTLAGGQIAAAQAQQAGTANLIGLGGSLYQAAGGASGIWETAKDVGTEVMSWF